MGCLYMLTSPSGKRYIGLTRYNAEERFRGHVATAKFKPQLALARAIAKYGADVFSIRTLLVADDLPYLWAMEAAAIAKYQTQSPRGYNLAAGGGGVAALSPVAHARKVAGLHRAWARDDGSRKEQLRNYQAVRMRQACADPQVEAERRADISQTMKERGIGRGEGNAMARLTADDARTIYAACKSGASRKAIALKYGISFGTVDAIAQRKRWRHATEAVA